MGAEMVCLREYAGILRVACPGTGCAGLPTSSRMRSADHLSFSGFLITVATLNTPMLVPMRCSAVRISKPSHSPSFHKSSYLPGMNCVLGILKWTVSPNSAILDMGCRPLIFCIAVRPSGLTRHRDMRHAAWRIIQATI